jgi:CBS domain-containing protein
MRVADLLKGKGDNVATIDPAASVRDAIVAMSERNIGALVVSSGDGAIEGIISERDVVRHLTGEGAAILDGIVSGMMSTEVHTCVPDDELASLMHLMTDHRIRHVPVVIDGRLAGIVSIGDVVKSRLGELEEDRRVLYDYINAR